MIRRHDFTTRDKEFEAIEQSLPGDFVKLSLWPDQSIKATILTSFELKAFRDYFSRNGWSFGELAREFHECRSVIILRPEQKLFVYTCTEVTPFSNLWARMRRGDRDALRVLNRAAANPTAAG